MFAERQDQEARYGVENLTTQSGSGPGLRWLLPYSDATASEIQQTMRNEYEDYEGETGSITWVRLVREEVCEAFQESDPTRLAEELIQVAALCVSWVERLVPESPETPLESRLRDAGAGLA